LSDDTLIAFWTKVPDDNIDPWSDICQPTVERIKKVTLIDITELAKPV
jgi:CRISPR-associated protein Csd1